MKKSVLALILLLSHSVFALDLAKYPTELTSKQGINVVIAPTQDQKQALVKVTGVNSDIDGVVLLTELKSQSGSKVYKYQFDGSKRSLIYVSDDYGCCSYKLYLPDTRDGIYLAKKDKAEPAVVTSLSALYDQQVAKGVQAKLAAFNREKHLKDQQAVITQADKNVAKQCGVEIPTTVEWSNIKDGDLGKYAVGAYCAQVSSKLADQCESKPEFKQVAKQFKAINCQFTDKLKLHDNDHVLDFKTAPKAPNQGQFIEAYLNNL